MVSTYNRLQAVGAEAAVMHDDRMGWVRAGSRGVEDSASVLCALRLPPLDARSVRLK